MWATTEKRKNLIEAVEGVIEDHLSYLEKSIALNVKEGREERIRLFNDTESICENMKEVQALDLIFTSLDMAEIRDKYDDWIKATLKKEEEEVE